MILAVFMRAERWVDFDPDTGKCVPIEKKDLPSDYVYRGQVTLIGDDVYAIKWFVKEPEHHLYLQIGPDRWDSNDPNVYMKHFNDYDAGMSYFEVGDRSQPEKRFELTYPAWFTKPGAEWFKPVDGAFGDELEHGEEDLLCEMYRSWRGTPRNELVDAALGLLGKFEDE